MISLYDFQAAAVEELRENMRSGVKNQILSAPTGSGKTIVATYLIQATRENRKRALFVADRVSLIDQTSAVFDRYEIAHGVIQANHWRWRPWESIQVASAQTLARRQWPEGLDLIVVDEAHTLHKTVVERIAARDCYVIGLTATPFTRGLGVHYDRVVSVTTTRELIDRKRLAPYQIFAASEPDMTGAKVMNTGEWADKEVEERVLPIVGDCVQEYLRYGRDRKFIAFGATIAHCEELQRQFLAAGIQCGLYTAHTPDEERRATVEEFRSPDSYIRGLISVAALAKGFDVEDVGVIIMARPLRKSLAEHLQIFGRGLRWDPNNPEKVCTVLDHAGNTLRFWDEMNAFFDDGATELDDGKPRKKKAAEKKAAEPRKCPACTHIHPARPACPCCGFEYPRRQIHHEDGELKALGEGAGAAKDVREAVYRQLLWIARDRAYKDGWAAHKYKERFGVWPRGVEGEPEVPSMELRRWVRSRQIAFAKAKKAS